MSWTNDTKSSASFSAGTKFSASFSNAVKSAASWFNAAKTQMLCYLLKEDGYKILLENGSGILLELSNITSNQSKMTTSFSNQAKN